MSHLSAVLRLSTYFSLIDTYKLYFQMLSEISSNVQEMFQTIDSLRRDSMTAKTVWEENIEHAGIHLIMVPKVSTINVNHNNR